jgi:hypothetical protein
MKRLTIVLCFLLIGCGSSMPDKIQYARLGVAAGGIGVDLADKTVAKVYADTKPEDTEGYCQQKIAAFSLRQAVIILEAGADSILLWEQAYATHRARKEAGGRVDTTWDAVLSSEAQWFKVAVKVVGVLDWGIETLLHFKVKIPTELTYAWKLLAGFTGKESPEPHTPDWGEIKQGVCADYLPGGG